MNASCGFTHCFLYNLSPDAYILLQKDCVTTLFRHLCHLLIMIET